MKGVKVSNIEEQSRVVNTLLLAFSNDPLQRYFMPDPSIYFKNSTIWFENAASQSISINSLFTIEDCSGVAIWFKPNFEVQFDALEVTMNDLPSDSLKDISKYFEEFQKNKPKDAWYLEYLGVDPSKHSLGIGSSLLKQTLEKIDQLHQPAYLESSNPRNLTLYKRHGFEVVTKLQFGNGPLINTMYREAR